MPNIEIKITPTVDGLEHVVGKSHYVTDIFDPRYNIRVKGMAYGKEESLTSAIDEYVKARVEQMKEEEEAEVEIEEYE